MSYCGRKPCLSICSFLSKHFICEKNNHFCVDDDIKCKAINQKKGKNRNLFCTIFLLAKKLQEKLSRKFWPRSIFFECNFVCVPIEIVAHYSCFSDKALKVRKLLQENCGKQEVDRCVFVARLRFAPKQNQTTFSPLLVIWPQVKYF